MFDLCGLSALGGRILQCYHGGAMIKAVFLDMYGTLAGFEPSRFEVQSQACAEFGIELTPEGVLKGYAAADEYMSAQNAVRPLRLLDDAERARFFGEYEKRVLSGDGAEVATELAMKIWDRIREIPYGLALYADAVPALRLLRSSGLTLGMISNIDRDGAELAESLGLSDHLGFTVTSTEVGAEKPDPRIFEAALAKAGATPSEAVHVGDQISSDIEGALGAGITPVLIDRDGNHRGYDTCPRIESLAEIPPLILDLIAGEYSR